ncbi:MAG: hypothetical protein AUK31_02320 [Fibrobacteres bacterium CG2_30_45_31]|nr:MAG: hypothetical protein AUK31_02320 [Fibrobacteres bacterium CG2_30_45_31]
MKLCALILCFQVAIFAAVPEVDTLRIPAGRFVSPTAVWHQGIPQKPKVIIWFHGGMQSTHCDKGLVGGTSLATLAAFDPSMVVVSPSACESFHWLSGEVLQVMDAVLDSLEMRWKVKVTEVSLVGVSDGGLGVLEYTLQGKRSVTSRMLVSTNLTQAVDPRSLATTARAQMGFWLFVQGGADRLYSSSTVLPWLDTFCQKMGSKRCELKMDPRGEHDWSWWLQNRKAWLEGFVKKAFP